MARFSFLTTHRTWEDYAGMALGAAIAVSPFIFAETAGHAWHNSFLEFALGRSLNHAVLLNAMVVGLLIFILAAFELDRQDRLQEATEFISGCWLIASPFALGYAASGQLRWWHFSLGALVALFALLELWQARDRVNP